MGGAALHLGNIAEMKTGEGKTLVATLPAYLNALSGKGVHVVTVNDYLAERDSEWMGRVHHFLGLTVGVILANMTPRRAPRAPTTATSPTAPTTSSASTTCATTWRGRSRSCVQRGHNFAIVDEVDSILIDEARTPLIISGPADDADQVVRRVRPAGAAPQARRRGQGHPATTRSTRRSAPSASSSPASTKVEDWLGIDNLYESVNTPLVCYLNNAIKAKELFRSDKDYVVMNGEVLIVDEHTGRILAGRRYNEGMHQAIEAKEGVEIKQENQTLATITLQNYFRLYDKLSGMTGTAMTEAAEFDQIYKLGVVPIPTNQPMAAPRPARPRLPHRGGEVRRRRRRHRRAAREGPAGPGRHHERREVRAPVRRCCASAASRTRCSTPSTTTARRRSSRRPAARARSPSPPTWPVAAPTSCSAATPSSSPRPSCASRGSARSTPPRSTRPRGPAALEQAKKAGRGRARRGHRRSAASTCSAPSATSRAASTTSCAVVPAVRATRASPGSTSRSRTT